MLNLISLALWQWRHIKVLLFPCLRPLHSADPTDMDPLELWVAQRYIYIKIWSDVVRKDLSEWKLIINDWWRKSTNRESWRQMIFDAGPGHKTGQPQVKISQYT